MSSEKQIQVKANAKLFTLPDNLSLVEFLNRLDFSPGMVVVERNRMALTPSETLKVSLHEGDELEIVRIVAGG
ncbi:MAG: sulfur carrier protein ThiS [Opitutales bacterium]